MRADGILCRGEVGQELIDLSGYGQGSGVIDRRVGNGGGPSGWVPRCVIQAADQLIQRILGIVALFDGRLPKRRSVFSSDNRAGLVVGSDQNFLGDPAVENNGHHFTSRAWSCKPSCGSGAHKACR